MFHLRQIWECSGDTCKPCEDSINYVFVVLGLFGLPKEKGTFGKRMGLK